MLEYIQRAYLNIFNIQYLSFSKVFYKFNQMVLRKYQDKKRQQKDERSFIMRKEKRSLSGAIDYCSLFYLKEKNRKA